MCFFHIVHRCSLILYYVPCFCSMPPPNLPCLCFVQPKAKKKKAKGPSMRLEEGESDFFSFFFSFCLLLVCDLCEKCRHCFSLLLRVVNSFCRLPCGYFFFVILSYFRRHLPEGESAAADVTVPSLYIVSPKNKPKYDYH